MQVLPQCIQIAIRMRYTYNTAAQNALSKYMGAEPVLLQQYVPIRITRPPILRYILLQPPSFPIHQHTRPFRAIYYYDAVFSYTSAYPIVQGYTFTRYPFKSILALLLLTVCFESRLSMPILAHLAPCGMFINYIHISRPTSYQQIYTAALLMDLFIHVMVWSMLVHPLHTCLTKMKSVCVLPPKCCKVSFCVT